MSIDSLPIALLLALASVIMLCGGLAASHSIRMLTERWNDARRVMTQLKPSSGLENNLNLLLEWVARTIDVPQYAFYILDDNKQKYTLKAIRHQKPHIGKAAPSYSGLTPYSSQPFLPPTSLSMDRGMANRFAWVEEEGVLLLQFVVADGFGIVIAGPIQQRPRRIEKRIAQTAELLSPLAEWVFQAERQALKENAANLTSAAWKQLSRLVSDPEVVVQTAFRLAAKALDLEEESDWNVEPSVPVAEGDSAVVMVAEEESGKLRFICRYRTPGRSATRVFRTTRIRHRMSVRHISASLLVSCQAAEEYYRAASRTKLSYTGKVEALKRLSTVIDNANPWTVGYSEQMSRYASVLAKELGLSGEQIQDIALAAYLSNIGALGLSEDLLTKEGRYSEDDFERMKHHADFGALLVEMTLGNRSVAESIRHHHERMDGQGYPGRLQGGQIPMGAQIIAVVQTYLAAINGRPNREPLPFDDVIARLQAASGPHLNQAAVEAFVAWFHRKRSDAGSGFKPLGACWEMCCTPSALCETCPVFGERLKPCWEFESNHCLSHGKSCKTCFIYTEAEGRSMREGKIKRGTEGGTE